MRPFRPAILAFLALSILAGCGKAASSKPEPKRTLDGAHDSAANDSQRPRLQAVPPEPRPTILPTAGECAPKSPNRLAVASCYNNNPCRGQWIQSAAGTPACACFSQKDGCEEGKICCAATKGCTKPEECYAP
jgi:hypothetical protein